MQSNAFDMPAPVEPLLDDTTFELFFKQNFTSLCTYCRYHFDFDLDTAKEAAHSAFIKLWENRQSLSDAQAAKPYLYKTATNVCLDLIRHQKVKQQYARITSLRYSPGTRSCEEHPIDAKQLEKDIQTAIAELPDQMRRVFELSRQEGLKYAEIAREMNLSVKTVETQMSRALARLRQRLSPYLTVGVLLLISSFLK